MRVEVTTPDDYLGEVLSDISARRGRIQDLQAPEDLRRIYALAPLAELFGYATALRSLSRGRAAYTMEPSQFEVVPETMQAGILNR